MWTVCETRAKAEGRTTVPTSKKTKLNTISSSFSYLRCIRVFFLKLVMPLIAFFVHYFLQILPIYSIIHLLGSFIQLLGSFIQLLGSFIQLLGSFIQLLGKN